MGGSQPDLFGSEPSFPEGFRYEEDLIPPEAERALVAWIAGLPFRAFEFHGHVGRRRVVSFGWEYDFSRERVHPTEEMPAALLPLRDRAAAFAGLAPRDLPHALVTEYQAGATIGWHRDAPVFGSRVVGVSLRSGCRLRFQRGKGDQRRVHDLAVAPRSAYLLSGAARSSWQHSIPPVPELRYSVTFRTLRATAAAPGR